MVWLNGTCQRLSPITYGERAGEPVKGSCVEGVDGGGHEFSTCVAFGSISVKRVMGLVLSTCDGLFFFYKICSNKSSMNFNCDAT